MKVLGLITGAAIGLLAFTNSGDTTKHNIGNKITSYQVGEKLRYRVTYGLMDAGEAILEVKNSSKKINGKNAYHVIGTGRTLGAFKLFYKVHDVYESHIDKETAFPLAFKRRVDEGGHKISQDYDFNHKTKKVKTQDGKNFDVNAGIQDMISSFYFARTIDMSDVKVGDTLTYNCFMDNEVWPLKIKYRGIENIRIRKGKFRCFKFSPVVQKGKYFKSDEDVEVWITDDNNRIPIYVKAKLKVGSVKLHLVEWKNLKHTLAKI
jgi:hypothetical protein